MKISKKEQYLLGILATVLVVALYYQFVYIKQVDKIEVLEAEKQEVENKYDEIMETIRTLEQRRSQIKIYNAGISDKMKLYYPGIVQEYIILEIDKMLKDSGINGTVSFSQISASTVEVITPGIFNKVESSLEPIVDEYNKHFKNEEEDTSSRNSIIDDEVVATSDATAEQVKVNLSFTGTYENLKKFLDIVDSQERKLAVTNISLSQGVANSISGSLALEFYGIPKLNNEDSSYFEWKLNNPSGKDNLFSINGVVNNATIESLSAQKNNYDFIMLAKSINSDLPTVMVGKANDTTNLSYIYADNKGIEEVELVLTKINGEYFYKYRTSQGSYPGNYSVTGDVFIPVSEEIVFEVVSQARANEEDLSGVSLKVINNTDKTLNIVISGDDSSNPRITVNSQGSSSVKVTNK